MFPTTPPRPRSSPASARAIVLEPKPSRALGALWVGLHALLGLAAVLAALPWPLSLLAASAAVAHGVRRRPKRPPERLVVGDDGHCRVGDGEPLGLAPGTCVGAFWVRLVLAGQRDALDILLLKDQVSAEQWARLAAALRRARVGKLPGGRSGPPELR